MHNAETSNVHTLSYKDEKTFPGLQSCHGPLFHYFRLDDLRAISLREQRSAYIKGRMMIIVLAKREKMEASPSGYRLRTQLQVYM